MFAKPQRKLILINLFISLTLFFFLLPKLTLDLSLQTLPVFLILLTFISLLVHLAVKDAQMFTIPSRPLYMLTFLSIALNLIFFIVNGSDSSFILGEGIRFSVGANIIGALIYALLLTIPVLLTKEKGMGEGDIWIAFNIGLLMGIDKAILSFYLAVLLTLTFATVIYFKTGKFRKLKIPFVPFMISGAFLALLLDISILGLLI
jgi:leader peptidase (prepilin peptidase)/N-methyltransferase